MKKNDSLAQIFGAGAQQSFGFLKDYQLTVRSDRKQIFRFRKPGDRIFAKLVNRRTAITNSRSRPREFATLKLSNPIS